MRYLFSSLLLIILLFNCRRDEITSDALKVDIYILKSFSYKVDQTTSRATGQLRVTDSKFKENVTEEKYAIQ